MSEKELLIQILQALNTFQLENIKAINYLREDIKENKKEIQKSREIETAHWEENLRRWEQNEKRWEENEKRWKENQKLWEENRKRWEENEKRWKENQKLWEEYRKNRKQDKNDIIQILMSYEDSISKSLGDANASKIKKLV